MTRSKQIAKQRFQEIVLEIFEEHTMAYFNFVFVNE